MSSPVTPPDRATKGYALKVCVDHATAVFGPVGRARILARTTPEIRALVPKLHVEEWYSREQQCALFRALAAEWTTDAEVYAGMRKLGMAMAKSVTNVFMRLVIRVLISNPAVLGKKLPQLYTMDNTGEGHIIADDSQISSRVLKFTWKSMKGYEYHQPICEGWLRFFFGLMGKGHASFETNPWDRTHPDPEEFTIAIRW